MTSDLQQTRYDKLVRRVGGIIGPGSKVSEALPELFPVLDVENVPGELLLLAGTKICFGGGFVAATPAQSGRAQLFNPAGSGQLATVTTVHVSAPGNTSARWGVRAAAIAVDVGTATLSDLRNFAPDSPVCQVRQEASAALANATGQSRVLGGAMNQIRNSDSIIVLAPGTGFEVGLAANNLDFHFTFYWREREALQSELNLP